MATLESAVHDQNFDQLQEILNSSSKISPEILDKNLTSAISKGFIDAVVPLLSHGARITRPAFNQAMARKDPVVFQAFLDYGWDVNSTEFKHPPLRMVMTSEKCAKWLLDHGADPNIRFHKSGPPLATAALEPLSSSQPVLDLLISYGAELDVSALLSAMKPRGKGGIPVMQYLVDRGIDVNGICPPWGTPLHFAVIIGSMEKVEFLLEKGADPTIRNVRDMTPADIAAENGRVDIVEVLSK